jgi:P27 family predicted phage terminase small subunit
MPNPPKPNYLKALAGNPGGRPLSGTTPTPQQGIPKCPSHLDKVARTEWRRISRELQQLGLLTLVDRAALAGYCQSWSRWVKAEKTIAAEGMTFVTSTGYIAQHPAVGISNTALKMMQSFLQEFGMTPASRARATSSPKEDGDDFFN